MLKNYIKTALRNLTRNKTVSAINIIGLVLGIGVTLLISLYVIDQLSYDQLHTKGDQIYRLVLYPDQDRESAPNTDAFPPLGPGLVENFPEVEKTVRFDSRANEKVTYNNNESLFARNFLYADSSLFDVFSFELISGSPKQALAAPFSAVLTEGFAEKMFEDESPIGKTINIRDEDFTVTGIVKDPPEHSSIKFELLLSYSTLYITNKRMFSEFRGGWGLATSTTYFLMSQDADLEKVENNIPAYLKTQTDKPFVLGNKYELEPLSNQYLYSPAANRLGVSNNIIYVYIFSCIAIIVLLIAVFNYVNLTTAQYSKRIKEVGARKALGAQKTELVYQFMGESLLVSTIAGIMAIVLVELSIPFVNGKLGLSLSSTFFSDPFIVGIILFVILTTGIIGGIYPAYILSRFKASEIINNRTKVTQGASVRKVLTTFQYSMSIVLLIGVFVINAQLDYAMTTNLGFQKDQILVVEKNARIPAENITTYLNSLKRHTGIKNATISSGVPGKNLIGSTISYGDEETENMFAMIGGDANFFETYQLSLIEGREFGEYYGSDINNSVIINESAANYLGYEEPIGKTINYWGNREREIIGVVKDFHFESLKNEIQPLIILPLDELFPNYVSVHFDASVTRELINYAEAEWSAINTGYPFEYFFMDDLFAQYYQQETRMAYLFNVFSVFTFLIAGMGLFGLAVFSVERRRKELSIRKTYGASVLNIVTLVSSEFIKLVGIGFIISIPFAFYFGNKWLQQFVYRIELTPIHILASGLIALLIALITVGWYSFNVAKMNPADNLRAE